MLSTIQCKDISRQKNGEIPRIDKLVHEICNSSVLAMELHLSCTKPVICTAPEMLIHRNIYRHIHDQFYQNNLTIASVVCIRKDNLTLSFVFVTIDLYLNCGCILTNAVDSFICVVIWAHFWILANLTSEPDQLVINILTKDTSTILANSLHMLMVSISDNTLMGFHPGAIQRLASGNFTNCALHFVLSIDWHPSLRILVKDLKQVCFCQSINRPFHTLNTFHIWVMIHWLQKRWCKWEKISCIMPEWICTLFASISVFLVYHMILSGL